MKQFLSFICTVLICTVLSIAASNWLLNASTSSNSTITIMATVRPQRIIIVDKNLVITKIMSNTDQEMRPLVLLESTDGSEIPYSESIAEQYLALKPALNFSKPGIVYEQSSDSIVTWIKRFLSALS